MDRLCRNRQFNIAPSTLQLYLVCLFWILHVKYCLIKHLVIKSRLHVWFVWLMSRFSEWDWHSLFITVCAHESHYAYTWLLLHTGTDGDNKPISAASCTGRESSQKERPASSLFVWTHPLLDLGSLLELSAHCCFSFVFFTCTTVWRCCMVELYTKTQLCYIRSLLWTIIYCIFAVFMLRNRGKKNCPIKCVRQKTNQCRGNRGGCFAETCSEELTHLNSLPTIFSLIWILMSFSLHTVVTDKLRTGKKYILNIYLIIWSLLPSL